MIIEFSTDFKMEVFVNNYFDPPTSYQRFCIEGHTMSVGICYVGKYDIECSLGNGKTAHIPLAFFKVLEASEKEKLLLDKM
jgi:hypothetical protein